jgi:hypothetical protein
MIDVLLTGTLACLQLGLGAMGIWLTLKPLKENERGKHHIWIGAFLLIGFIGVALTLFLAGRANSAQDRLNTQLADLRVSQAAERGEVKATREIMEGIAKTGIPGLKEFAESVLQAVQAPKQALTPSELTNAQLCERTTSLARNIRSFESDFNSAAGVERDKWIQSTAGKTREQMSTLQQNYFQQETQGRQAHGDEFIRRFLSDAKYDHDQIIDRLSAAKRDQLKSHNGEADLIIEVGHFVGAMQGYGVANYLDELAKTLCSK